MRIQDFRPQSAQPPIEPDVEAAPVAVNEPPSQVMSADAQVVIERQGLEIMLLKARIDHLEIVVETARGLLGTNQERLLRRLYDLPREVVKLSQRLQRTDLAAPW